MKKYFLLFICFCFLCGCSILKKDKKIDNGDAIVDEKRRTVTIVNNTNEVINEFHLFVNEGTELMEYQLKNIDEQSFSIEISEKYEKYENFTFIFYDRYGLKYGKESSKVNKEGNTEIVIDKDDEISEKGDFWKKVDRLFN